MRDTVAYSWNKDENLYIKLFCMNIGGHKLSMIISRIDVEERDKQLTNANFWMNDDSGREKLALILYAGIF